jgi:cellulose synthase/poly-beta-1,6-N-acetylglucosamine synthase-like glycosyltransferase
VTTIDIVLSILAVPVSVANAYLLSLTFLSRQKRPISYGAPETRFAIVVPAHDEEAGIGATVSNLLSLDYPKDRFSVTVVADNCSDETAARAEKAGARVLVRHDNERRGKGYALAHAFERLASTGSTGAPAGSVPAEVDAIVVVDADTVVSKNLLRAFGARIDAGALAVQADYAVRNPEASWRTRLMAIAFGAFHVLRSLARERLRLSSGLRGNGMCFTSQVLAQVPHDAYSIVEDVEYGIRLGEAGHRIHYAAEAHVYGDMVSSAGASQSQRQRWERGRAALARARGLPLFGRALLCRDLVLLDLAIDILLPPLSTLAMWVALGFGLALVSGYFLSSEVSLRIWIANLMALSLYVLRGWSLSGTGWRGLVELACAPFYVAWKLWMRATQTAQPKDWVRTAREPQPETTAAPP